MFQVARTGYLSSINVLAEDGLLAFHPDADLRKVRQHVQ